jgi:hypothetical protein
VCSKPGKFCVVCDQQPNVFRSKQKLAALKFARISENANLKVRIYQQLLADFQVVCPVVMARHFRA